MEAAAMLRRGELVAFPTETVYGLGAHALDPEAVTRIYAAKGRPAWNPVIVHVDNVSAAQALAAEWPAHAQRLAETCWPGPLTLVLRKHASVPAIVTAGTDTVAIRVPDHPVALELLRVAQLPIAAPSANRFTALSPTTAKHVAHGLGDRVALILDGGPCAIGIESTVVDLTGEHAVILRPGGLSADELSARLGATVRLAHRDASPRDGAARSSPGLSVRHYAPRAEVWLLDPHDDASRAAIERALAARLANGGGPVGFLAREGTVPLVAATHTTRLPDAPAAFARGLYAALHELDAVGCSHVVIDAPPASAAWDAVRDRLQRATM